ncbi:MAG: tyrosine-type recombinase/integrase [Lachnospiraceae bacterium]|nr:tyrosine-type recombinase/integrase [Lachnospiraceae bacterium]MDD3616714.1 tyrosine-type recombinase/integrase [Lachnospiraceae bacterium]
MTVLDLMKRHIDLQWNGVKEPTRNGYRTQLNFMETDPMGKKKIKDVDSVIAEEWFQDLHESKGKNYSTLCTLRGILKPAFTRAKKARWVYDNPFDFPMQKKLYGENKTREAITRRDMRRFLDFTRTDKHFSRYFNGIYILFHTGLRISEFCGLTADDIDFKKHEIHVRRQLIRIHDGNKMLLYIETPKTKNSVRNVPMFSSVEEAFRDVIAKRPHLETEPVVWNQEHTEYATKFLWFDRDKHLEVAQHWQNHIRWTLQKFNKTYKEEITQPISPHVCVPSYILF